MGPKDGPFVLSSFDIVLVNPLIVCYVNVHLLISKPYSANQLIESPHRDLTYF